MFKKKQNTEDMGRWRVEASWGKLEGEMNNERLWTLGIEWRVLEGTGLGGWVTLVMGIKEGMYCMEHCVLHTNNESWNTTSKANDVLYCD